MGTWEMTGGIKIVSEQNLGSYVTLQPTNTTNTFTPTTLKTIEQMFVDVEEPETYKNQAGFAPPMLKHKTYINMDSSNWQQGGVTTVVTPSAAPPPSFELLQPSNQEEEKKVNRGGGRKPRDKEEETLCPEEEERRKMRRERNKLAAARCRKRRVDQRDEPARLQRPHGRADGPDPDEHLDADHGEHDDLLLDDQLRAPPDADRVDALLRESAANEPEHGASRAWKSEHRRTFGISVIWSDQLTPVN